MIPEELFSRNRYPAIREAPYLLTLGIHDYYWFRLLPERFFLSNPKLDYALVAVEGTSNDGKRLEDYGFHRLIGKIGKAVVGECVNVVQHPGGRVKQIAIRNNRLLDLPGESDGEKLDPYFLYEADTEKGSSGSPVFNDQWEVVALHHAAVPKMKDGQLIDTKGKVIGEEGDDSRIVWIANEGIRVSRLVADVAAARDRIPEAMRAKWGELLKAWEAEDLGQKDASAPEHGRPFRRESLPASGRSAVAPAYPTHANGDGMLRPGLANSVSRIEFMLPLRLTIEFGAPEPPRRYEEDPDPP